MDNFSPTQRVFKTTDQCELNLHVFDAGERASRLRSAIVFFFGGGWNSGTPEQFYPHCRHFSKRGMLAISAEYRVKSRHNTTPFECVKDGKSAIRWLRAHADELHVDPCRIVAGGGSAGGHVAACTAVIDGYEEASEDLGISSAPNALLLFNPVIDTSPTGYGTYDLSDISPTHHVRPNLPPTQIFHGTADETVPLENAERFTRLMKEAGNICELTSFKGQGHGFFNYQRDDGAAYHDTIKISKQFLTQHGFLNTKHQEGNTQCRPRTKN